LPFPSPSIQIPCFFHYVEAIPAKPPSPPHVLNLDELSEKFSCLCSLAVGIWLILSAHRPHKPTKLASCVSVLFHSPWRGLEAFPPQRFFTQSPFLHDPFSSPITQFSPVEFSPQNAFFSSLRVRNPSPPQPSSFSGGRPP